MIIAGYDFEGSGYGIFSDQDYGVLGLPRGAPGLPGIKGEKGIFI